MLFLSHNFEDHFHSHCLFNYQIGKFMSRNLDFFSAKSGIRTRGLTTAADSEVLYLSPNSPKAL